MRSTPDRPDWTPGTPLPCLCGADEPAHWDAGIGNRKSCRAYAPLAAVQVVGDPWTGEDYIGHFPWTNGDTRDFLAFVATHPGTEFHVRTDGTAFRKWHNAGNCPQGFRTLLAPGETCLSNLILEPQ